MRHMNWDYPALMACPMDVLEEIVAMMVERESRR